MNHAARKIAMSTDLIANKYKIVREIARSNDVVYEAIDTTMGRRLAVKELLIPPNLTGQARRERIERFNREARATGRLSHPNIVTVYDFGEDGGRYFIAMEYLEGGTLRDLLQTRGALPLKEAIDIACQVLSALIHAHAHKVIHRDVKPDNIHILPDGQIKLTDFGIARLTEEASLTGEGQVFGTPSYMSPEQIEGRYVDHRTDIFSVGVLLYEMVAGRKPFTGDSVVSITYNIMHHDPPPLVGIPQAVERVILRALAKEPLTRYSTAEEMRHELKNADAVPSLFLSYSPLHTGPGGSAPGSLPPPAASFPSHLGGPGSYGGHGAYPPTGGQAGTVFSPPPAPTPPAQTGSGPFTSWNPQSGNSPSPAYVPPPPPFPRRRSGPLISEGTRVFLVVLFWTILISSAIVGLVLLFLRAYEQQQRKGASVAIEQIVEEGNRLYQAGRLEEAAARFEQALLAGAGTSAGKTARNNLIITYNELGVNAYQRGDFQSAESYWYRVLDIEPNHVKAHRNLGDLYDRLGDRDRALQAWRRSKVSGRVGGENPAAPGRDTSLQARLERAQQYFAEGLNAFRQGDVEKARDFWNKTVGEAPGTPFAQQAQQMLDQTTNPPNF